MQTEERIFILKGEIKNNIANLSFNERTRKYDVVFDGGKRYRYSQSSVDILPLVKCTDVPTTVRNRKNGYYIRATHIDEFQNSNYTVYRIFSEKDGNERHFDMFQDDVEFPVPDDASESVLGYLSEVANHINIPLDDGEEISLGSKYKRLGTGFEGSLMASFLNPDTYRNNTRHNGLLIFPFGCNSSQYKAVVAALNNKLSIIQGPPGTGKTQTILNIIANLLLTGKTMQVVSNNNSAVENVMEKLAKPEYELDFLVAQLGNKENKEKFINNQAEEYPKLDAWHISDEQKSEIENQLPHVTEQLLKLYAKQERLAIVKQELMEYEVQKSHLQIPDDINCPESLTSDTALKLMNRCTFEFERKGKLGFFTRLALWQQKIRKKDDVIKYLQTSYFVLKIAELQEEINQLQSALQNIDSLQASQVKMSLKYIKGFLESKYNNKKHRKFELSELKTSSDVFLKEYPIVLSTTFSATDNIGNRTRFDYLIMDEASQVDVASGALALNCTENAVIVGDIKQLPNVVTDQVRTETDSILASYKIPSAYHYTTNSFLESVCQLFPNVPNTLLKEHYRCHPLIIGFCNKQFYNGELIPMRKVSCTDNALMLCMTSAGCHAHEKSNLTQANVITIELVPRLICEGYKDIGVIAPYRNQANLIDKQLAENSRVRKLMTENKVDDVPAETVHKFQGRENDCIILSTVDDEISDFVDKPHLLNVAVSRAKDLFILLVSGNEQKDSNIKDLIDYIRYYNSEEIQTSVKSVFDLLYGPMTEKRIEFLQQHKRVSEYDSENLMYALLCDTVRESGLGHFSILCHYPLRLLVNENAGLTEEEALYASRNGTHLDFLVYNTVSRMPLFAIEVDGYTYHNERTEQASRDKLKNSIMSKIGLRLERFRTDDCMERERIMSILNDSAIR